MKTYVIVSANGKDRPGFVNRITHTIKEHGGNIEMQRSTRMAAEFALLILYSVEAGPDAVTRSIEALNALRAEHLYVSAREAVGGPTDAEAGGRSAELIASGADQPGIIDAVTMLLFQNHVNIESMEYDVESAPMTGEHLFRMHARLSIPEDVPLQELRAELRAMEADYNFDVLLQPKTDA